MAQRVSLIVFKKMLQDKFKRNVLHSSEIRGFAKEEDVQIPGAIWDNKSSGRSEFVIGEGIIPAQNTTVESDTVAPTQEVVKEMVGGIAAIRNTEQQYFVDQDPKFIKWGKFSDIRMVIKSSRFFPTFITGLSGNGKTTGIEQACANERREAIRVNFTRETNEDDLLGGMRLIAGDTVFQYGPVAEAYMRGAVLILDEVDLADPNKVMVLQSVLEGKPIFIKKLGKRIAPAAGFNVFATANTKGKGSSDGRFMGTNSLNEAFLDRFAITIEQDYPGAAIEKRMLKGYAEAYTDEVLDERALEVIDHLVQWAQITRQSFKEESIDELISTRRLIATIESYFIFGENIKKSVEYATARFDDEMRETFVELYSQIDAGMRTFTENEENEENA